MGAVKLANVREVEQEEAKRIFEQGIPVYRPSQKENPWAVSKEYEFRTREELSKEKRFGARKLQDYKPREVAEF